MKYKKIYAVDFDGTLSLGTYPRLGNPNKALIFFLRTRQQEGDTIILWTCREGKLLKEAVDYCRKCGLEFDAVNDNAKQNIENYGNNCRKVFAHYYIDDRSMVNIPGLGMTRAERGAEDGSRTM